MVTLAHGVRDALARAPEVYWDREWLGPLDMHRFVPFEEYNAAALLCEPRPTGRLEREWVRSLIGIGTIKFDSKPDRGHKQRLSVALSQPKVPGCVSIDTSARAIQLPESVWTASPA
jgi:hypothetical protein